MTGRSPLRRLLVSCGEDSGDLYASALLEALRARVPDLAAYGFGGDRLAAAGAELLTHVRDLAVGGFLEVVPHYARIRRLGLRLLERVRREPPDVAVLVDYSHFNLRLGHRLRRRGIPVVYYVAPKFWAWRLPRIHRVRDRVSHVLVVFPFEERIYREAGVPVTFVGNPLLDLVAPARDPAAFRAAQGLDARRPLVALLPGSRPLEVRNHLPRLMAAVRELGRRRPELQFALALAPSIPSDLVAAPLSGTEVRLLRGEAHALIGESALALAAMGTATLEAALLGTPMVTFYRLSPLTYALGRPLVRAPFSLPNLLAGREVVAELLQADFRAERVVAESLPLLDPGERHAAMKRDLAEVRQRLGPPGASARAAEAVLSLAASS